MRTCPTWRDVSYSLADVQRVARRAERRRAAVARTLAAMKRGASLHLQHTNGRPLWSLSDGRFVAADVAELVVQRPEITDCGGSLFHNMPGQVWRYVE